MILPHQPEDASIGFKVRRQKGNWRVFKQDGKPFNGRFQVITTFPRGLGKSSGGVKEDLFISPKQFMSLFN